MENRVMATVRFALAATLVALCTGRVVAEPPASNEHIRRDLELNVTLKTPKTIQAGEHVKVEMVLHNRSRTDSHAVVAPGDGSESGWREPYVYFTATLDPLQGPRKEIPKSPNYGRCGLYDSQWQKSIVLLKPDEKLPLKSWTPTPSRMLEFQEAGRVRLVAHYRYQAGVRKGGSREPAPTAGPMAGVPPFEIDSAPVEFDVVRPLDLVATAKGPAAVIGKSKISDVLDLRLVNRSDKPIEVPSPTLSADARLVLEFEDMPRAFSIQNSTYGEKVTLKPAEEAGMIGVGRLANGLDGPWPSAAPGLVKVRASFRLSTWKPSPTIRSNWVEVKVVRDAK